MRNQAVGAWQARTGHALAGSCIGDADTFNVEGTMGRPEAVEEDGSGNRPSLQQLHDSTGSGQYNRSSSPTLDELMGGDRTSTRLSQLSCSAKYALPINQIDRVEIAHTYDRAADGVTIYVLDVYLQDVQVGIPLRHSELAGSNLHDRAPVSAAGEEDPAATNATNASARGRPSHEKSKSLILKKPKPDYQVEYRYSEFRALREQVREALKQPSTGRHKSWCRYCSRVEWVAHYVSFPSRSVVPCIRDVKIWRKVIAWHRKKKLTEFMQRLLRSAKDNSYRYGRDHCDGFVNISFILKDFLGDHHSRTSHSIC